MVSPLLLKKHLQRCLVKTSRGWKDKTLQLGRILQIKRESSMDFRNFIEEQLKNLENSQELEETAKRETKKSVNNIPVSDLRCVASGYGIYNVYAIDFSKRTLGRYDPTRNVIYLHYEISVESAKLLPDLDELEKKSGFRQEAIKTAHRLKNNRECLIRTCDDAVYHTLFHEIGHKKTSPPPLERASDFEEIYNSYSPIFNFPLTLSVSPVEKAYKSYLELKAEEWGISALKSKKFNKA